MSVREVIGGIEYLEAESPYALRDEVRRWLGENRVLEVSQVHFLPPLTAVSPAEPPSDGKGDKAEKGEKGKKEKRLVFGAYVLYLRSGK